MPIDPRVTAFCAELDIEIIPKHLYPMPGQTRAVASIARLTEKHGEAHARLVLTDLARMQGQQCSDR
jgi:hypothetical protein